jgi:PAS domain S-box-containing protein
MVWDGFHLDITERKIAEEKIRFDFDLLNAVGQSVIATDTKGNIIYWNNAAEKIYGWSAAEATGQNIIDIFSSKQNKKEATEIVNAIRKGNSWSGEFKVQRKDGTSSPVFVTDTPVYDQKGGLIGIIGVSVDISERKKTEKTIKLMEKKILNQKIQEQKKISRAMIKAQEKERNYIGQELHDNINQILAGTKMYLCIAGKKNEALNQLIKYPVELIDKSIQEIRSLTHKLVTPTKQIDLEVLIRQLLTNLKLGTSIKTDFIYDVTNKFIPDDLKLNIYRIVQEGVINTVKYAEAKNIIIAVKANDKDIHIILADDGKGFKISSKRKGIGISNMINRAETFNGKIQIKSSPGTGCKISVKIPC